MKKTTKKKGKITEEKGPFEGKPKSFEGRYNKLFEAAIFRVVSDSGFLKDNDESKFDEILYEIMRNDDPGIREKEACRILESHDINTQSLQKEIEWIHQEIEKYMDTFVDSEKEVEAQEEIENRFIFDEAKLWSDKVFACDMLDKSTFYYGIFLPEIAIKRDRKGRVYSKEQVNSPALITSAHKIIPLDRNLGERYKIKFGSVPGYLELRLGLNAIRSFIKDATFFVDPRLLFEKVCNVYKEYMYFSDETWYKVHALWDIGTYFFMLFQAYPIMEIRGMPGTAKTKIMKISRMFTFNATKIMVKPSEPVLFRETNDIRPSKYIDEAEKLYRIVHGNIETDDRVELINSSYSIGGTVPRMEKIGDRYKCVYFKTYSPTMICSVNGLMGPTQERAIIHISIKTAKGDIRGNRSPDENEDRIKKIRNELYLFGLQHWRSVRDTYRELTSKTLSNRDFEIWRPILALAKYIDEDIYNEIVRFSDRLTKIKSQDGISEGTLNYRILSIMWEMIENKEPIFVKVIKERLGDNSPSPKSISAKIDRLGFMDYREHTMHGSRFFIKRDFFIQIISSNCPAILDMKINRKEEIKVTEEFVESLKGISTVKAVEIVLNGIRSYENKNGKLIEIESLFKSPPVSYLDSNLADKCLSMLKTNGDIFEPRPGFVQRI